MTAIFLSVFAALCWATHDQFARTCAERVGPFRMALAVVAAGAVLLAGFVLWHGEVFNAGREGIFLSLALGIAYAFGVGGIFKAFSLGPVSVVAPLTAAYPIIAVLWALFNGTTPSWLQWLAMVITLVGTLIVGRTGHSDGGMNAVKPGRIPALIFWCLVCSLGYAVAVIIGQKAGPMVGDVEAAWLSRFSTCLALFPFVAREPKTANLKPAHWGAILAMAALDVSGLVAVNMTGGMAGEAFAAMGISAYAAFGVLLAALILKERVSPGQWSGIAMIVIGVAMLGWPG